MAGSRRFPLPWTIHGSESAFWVEDADGKRFGYCYFDDRQDSIGVDRVNRLTRDEARRIVRNIVKLPGLLGH
jgi:hypothetical protein